MMCAEALQNLSDGMCIIDQNYRIVLWNKRLEKWSKHSANDLLGQRLDDVYPHLKEVEYKLRIDQVLQHGPPALFSMLLHHHIFTFQLDDGSVQAQRVTVSPLRNGDETLALFTIVDMTRSVLRESKYKEVLASYEREIEWRKRLERQNEMLVRAVDRAAEAFVIMRINGEIEYVNKVFLAQTGWAYTAFKLGESYWDEYL